MVLKVEHSFNDARWITGDPSLETVESLVRRHGLPEMVARLLVQRDIPSDDVPAFLSPSLKNDFPDPFSLQDMEKMADDLADSIADGRKIGVFADFDVDGATSAALLLRFLRHIGQEAPLYIPDRITEGYGPNSKAFQTLKDQGAEIVFVCDCGITAFDPIAAGRNCGLEIVVLDHHEAEDTLPPANHVIDPKRKEDTSGLSMLAACGVTFMACVAINAKLRAAGYYARTGLAEPPLKTWLDIVALGTVCDMVPLVGANRLFVKTGFSLMAHTENPGLKALLAVAGVNDAPTPYTAGFVLGPRINAGSRVHRADLGARLLATDDPEEAKNIAWTLNDCNAKRREIERQMIEEAIGQIESKALQNAPVIVVGDEGWHPGLSGLVAGRIKEKYGKPAVAVTYAPGPDNALEGRGSGRSVPGVNMGAAFIDARHAGLLIKGGGHAMAAGFTILPDRLPDFTAFLTAHVLKQQEGVPAVNDLAIDAVLSVRGATPALVRTIAGSLGPFGQGHEEPLFVLPQVRIWQADIVGDAHIRTLISDWEGGPRMKAMAFRAGGTKLGDALLACRDKPLHLAGTLKIDSWSGTDKVEMHIQDGAKAL